MDNRIELQTRLETLFNSKNVYYQPPESLLMEYPCIRYSRNEIDSKCADNINFINTIGYDITVIDKKPDNNIINKVLVTFPMSSYNRHYVSDNLNHDVIKLFF